MKKEKFHKTVFGCIINNKLYYDNKIIDITVNRFEKDIPATWITILQNDRGVYVVDYF